MRTSTAPASGSRERSIRGSTSRQSNPPLPHPRGGIAMDVMPSSRITRVKSRRPVSMSMSFWIGHASAAS